MATKLAQKGFKKIHVQTLEMKFLVFTQGQ